MKNAHRRTTYATLAICLAAGAILAAGCQPSTKALLSKADIRGTITSIHTAASDKNSAAIGAIFISGSIGSTKTVNQASITVTTGTGIYRLTNGKAVKTGFDAMEVGQTAQATFEGPVLESFPVQATARDTVILASPSATQVKDKHTAELMAIKGVVGVGVGELNGNPCIKVLLENDSADLKAKVPKTLEGYPVVTEVTGTIKTQ